MEGRKKEADKQLWMCFPLEGNVFQTAIPFTYFFRVRPPTILSFFFFSWDHINIKAVIILSSVE